MAGTSKARVRMVEQKSLLQKSHTARQLAWETGRVSLSVRGKVILQSQGKEFFTWHGKDFFT